MITVYVDLICPLYWWKEFDTYKVGTRPILAPPCTKQRRSSRWKISRVSIYSIPRMVKIQIVGPIPQKVSGEIEPIDILNLTIAMLNKARELYLDYQQKASTGDQFAKDHVKEYWWQMIQLLPSSYKQRRTVMLNYEVLANIYKSRRNHS
ncbi:MAG: hypothetical protein ACLSB9_35975 [Hydrogeniiclostridium mannosilyticum]